MTAAIAAIVSTGALSVTSVEAKAAQTTAQHQQIPPQPLFRVPGPEAEDPPSKSEYEEATGQQFPTFREVPLPPVPQGSGWTWTYHHSYWGSDGCLYDHVSYGGAAYDLVACCPEPTMSFPCPDH